ERRAVVVEAVALRNDRLLPKKPEPAHVHDHRFDELRSDARKIEIVVAQKVMSAGGLGALLGDPKRTGVSAVQVAGGRGGQSADRFGGGLADDWQVNVHTADLELMCCIPNVRRSGDRTDSDRREHASDFANERGEGFIEPAGALLGGCEGGVTHHSALGDVY